MENLTLLKIQYNDMVKNNTKKIFVFCLDSFFYQYKIYSAESEQIESSRKMVNNRMYCEYFKLFGIVSAYLNNINLTYESKRELLKTCPTYKDLEPMLEYDIGDIENIYNNTILLITQLYDQTLKNIMEIDGYNSLSGFSISNFVNTLRNENLILQGQIDLFMNYLSFFLASQQKQYSRIDERITNFLDILDEKSGRFVNESRRDSMLDSEGTPPGGAKRRFSIDSLRTTAGGSRLQASLADPNGLSTENESGVTKEPVVIEGNTSMASPSEYFLDPITNEVSTTLLPMTTVIGEEKEECNSPDITYE